MKGGEELHDEALCGGGPPEARGVGPPGPGLEQRKPDYPGGSPPHRTPPGTDPPHHSGRGVPGPHRGHGLRSHGPSSSGITSFGIPVERVVNCGGIAEKNDLFMQIYADVLGRPMLIAGSPQTPALGAAISAAVAAGAGAGGYDTFEAAQDAMTSLKDRALPPRSRLPTPSTTNSTGCTWNSTIRSERSPGLAATSGR